MKDGTTTASVPAVTTNSIRRILVALDATAESLAALDAAADLAERLRAELLGLFVEDIDLVNLAALPFTREIDLAAGTVADINLHTVERQFRVQKKKVRSALEKAAEARRLTWSFRTVRGQVTTELLKAAPGVDLVTVGKGGFPLTRRSRLGSTAIAVAGQNCHAFFVAGGREAWEKRPHRVSVAFDGSACARTALGIALGITGASDAVLRVFLLADSAAEGEKLKSQVAAIMEGWDGEGPQTNYTCIETSDETSLIRAAGVQGDDVLVVGGECPALTGRPIHRLLEAATCPVLLVK